jgi:probable HAF family extracellular repeat protein
MSRVCFGDEPRGRVASVFGGAQSSAFAINDEGDVVGGVSHAFLYQNGVMTDLNPYLTPFGLQNADTTAFDINNSDDIVLRAFNRSFLLVPVSAVPEPSAYGLTFGLIAASAIVLRRRSVKRVGRS